MGEEITITKVTTIDGDKYQIDILFSESQDIDRIFIKREHLFALLTIAESE